MINLFIFYLCLFYLRFQYEWESIDNKIRTLDGRCPEEVVLSDCQFEVSERNSFYIVDQADFSYGPVLKLLNPTIYIRSDSDN